jgi:hypothetical protein
VEVLYSEGKANHTGPKPCVSVREDRGEASAGDGAGRPLSRERCLLPSADSVTILEGNTMHRVNASGASTRRGQRHRHAPTLFDREPGDLTLDQMGNPLVRIGKAENAEAGDARAREVRLLHSSCEVCEQSRMQNRRRSGWSQGRGPQERRTATHVPDAEPGIACH